MSELASDVALITYHRFHGCFWRPCLFSFDLSSVCLWFRLLHKWGGGGGGVFPLVETVNKLQHTCWCAFTFFLRQEVDVWNCWVPVFEQIVLQQQSKHSRLYYSNEENPTDCTTATKHTQQIVLQQQSKPNRLYYSNKANSTN